VASKAWGMFSLSGSGWCLVLLGGLAKVMLTSSWRVASNTSRDMDMMSMDKVEAQFGVAPTGKRCGYVARRRVRR